MNLRNVHILIYTICFKIVLAKKFAIYTHLECPEPPVKAITIYNCSLISNSQGYLMLNVNLKFNHVLSNIMAKFRLSIKRGPRQPETFLNLNIDICEALSGAHTQFVLKMISLEILRTSNFPLECPLKKNFLYFIRNFTINDYYIPPYVPLLDWGTYSDFYVDKRKYLTFNSFGKIVDSKRPNRHNKR